MYMCVCMYVDMCMYVHVYVKRLELFSRLGVISSLHYYYYYYYYDYYYYYLSALEEDIVMSSLKIDLTNFWLRLRSDYPALANRALKHLVPFCTAYLCEQAFSVLL